MGYFAYSMNYIGYQNYFPKSFTFSSISSILQPWIHIKTKNIFFVTSKISLPNMRPFIVFTREIPNFEQIFRYAMIFYNCRHKILNVLHARKAVCIYNMTTELVFLFSEGYERSASVNTCIWKDKLAKSLVFRISFKNNRVVNKSPNMCYGKAETTFLDFVKLKYNGITRTH